MLQKKIKSLKNSNFKISTLTSWISALVFCIFGFGLVIFVNLQMRHYSVETAIQKARIILDRNFATHMYFSQRLKPEIFKLTDPITSDEYFNPVWMSSTYAIREIDKYFRTMIPENDYFPSDYYYKECAMDATVALKTNAPISSKSIKFSKKNNVEILKNAI